MSLKEKVMDLTVKRNKTLSTQLFSKTRAKLPRTRDADSPAKRASGGKADLSKVEAEAAGSREAANYHQERKALSSTKKSSKPKATTAGSKRAASASKPVGAAEAETTVECHGGGARSSNMQPTSGTVTGGGDKGESTDGRSTEEPRVDNKMAAMNKDDEKTASSREMGKIFLQVLFISLSCIMLLIV
jgi:hypothetical protein